jgi:DNA-binding NarL/FixJ family response regulator
MHKTIKGEKCAPDIFIIMQNVFEDEEKIFIAIHAGAHGYFLKKSPPGKLIEGTHDVPEGGAPMTPSVARKVLEVFQKHSSNTTTNHFNLTSREIEILSMLTRGMSYKMIVE